MTAVPSNYMVGRPAAQIRSRKGAAYLYEKCERRHTCLQQARYATDGLHDRDLRVGQRFGPERARFVSAHKRETDYAESGKVGSRFWAW